MSAKGAADVDAAENRRSRTCWPKSAAAVVTEKEEADSREDTPGMYISIGWGVDGLRDLLSDDDDGEDLAVRSAKMKAAGMSQTMIHSVDEPSLCVCVVVVHAGVAVIVAGKKVNLCPRIDTPCRYYAGKWSKRLPTRIWRCGVQLLCHPREDFSLTQLSVAGELEGSRRMLSSQIWISDAV